MALRRDLGSDEESAPACSGVVEGTKADANTRTFTRMTDKKQRPVMASRMFELKRSH